MTKNDGSGNTTQCRQAREADHEQRHALEPERVHRQEGLVGRGSLVVGRQAASGEEGEPGRAGAHGERAGEGCH